MISILLLSWERYHELAYTLDLNMKRCGLPFELLVCDQGSKDPRVVEHLKKLNPTYLRLNSRNEGVGKSFNQLYLRSRGEWIAMMSNDLVWPMNWGLEMTVWAKRVPNLGLVGINWGHSGVPPLETKHGFTAHYLRNSGDRVFGPTMVRREVIQKIGFFCEEYGPYGLEDSDFNERVTRAGFQSLYVPHLRSEHLVNDVGEQSEYRKGKDESASANCNVFNRRLQGFEKDNLIYEPLPPLRHPL